MGDGRVGAVDGGAGPALPREYRDLLEVAEDAGRPLRAKLKRLVERGWLAEEAGLFALPARKAAARGKR